MILSRRFVVVLLILWSSPHRAHAQVSALAETSRAAVAIERLAEQLRELRQQLDDQARQLEEYKQQLAEQQRQLEALHAQLATRSTSPQAAATPQTTAPPSGEPAAPLFWRLGVARITPGGFLDFTTIFRTTNVGSGIGTSFGSIPFSNTPAGRLSQTQLTAQNSRLSLKVEVPVGRQAVTGYLEADFLGVDPPNAFVTSNSHSFRLRLYWADLRRGRWEVLAGQSWSLLTPNRQGLSAMPADLFYTQNMDTNYQVGLTWARQAQLRLIYHASPQWAIGVSLENPQQTVTPAVVFPSTAIAAQFDNGSNPATPNLHPDVIVKTAYDRSLHGRAFHAELAGLLRSFKLFDPNAGRTHTLSGGGVAAAVHGELWPGFRLIGTAFWSDGGGRYLFGLGPDVVVRPDGQLSAVHAGSSIVGFEWQTRPAWLLYGYYGGVYFQRNFATVGNSSVGFGFPGSPSSANRTVQEATLGFVRTFWRNPTYGALQLITQFSYLTRSPWSVAAGQPKNARTTMGYADLRYVLP